jgi:hypothetical protein
MMPALFIRMSILPCRARIASRQRRLAPIADRGGGLNKHRLGPVGQHQRRTMPRQILGKG